MQLYLLQCWASPHPLLPGLQVGELVDFDSCPAGSGDPAPVGNIGNCALVTHEILVPAVLEMLVHYAVQTTGFILVAVDAVWDLFRGVLPILSIHEDKDG